MKITDLITKAKLEISNLADVDVDITDAYTGDILSDCLSHLDIGVALITSLLHENTLAVAKRTDCPCVIISGVDGINIELSDSAERHSVNLLYSDKSSFELSHDIYEALKGTKCI